MHDDHPEQPPAPLDDRAVALARAWLDESGRRRMRGAEAQLARVLRDPAGLAFATRFVDGVVRPEDVHVAAEALRDLASTSPAFLPRPLRLLLRLGGAAAPRVPRLAVPVARRVLRAMVGHLVVDASDARLGRALRRVAGEGIRCNVNLLGEAVLGRREAARRVEETRRLLRRPDVDYVSIKVSSAVAPHSPWALDEAAGDIADHLRPLYLDAAATSPTTFINLDMEEYRDLDLTIAVFTRLLDEPELAALEAGIVLQAYLPDALGAMEALQTWAATRRARGGAGIKVRLVKGANLPMERVEASRHGWPLATWSSKVETDAHYKAVLDWALRPDRIANVRIGVAGHNLFDVARAWLLAVDREVAHGVDIEMLLGMAPHQADAVRGTVGRLLLYTPVVHPEEFDVAIAYLVRRLEEGASPDNFLSAVFDLADDPALFAREERRFRSSTAAIATTAPPPNRTTDRYAVVGRPGPGRFVNTPDTDPSVAANRAWARDVIHRARTSTAGRAPIDAARIVERADLDRVVDDARAAGRSWGERPGRDRCRVLHAIGDALEQNRARLLEVMLSEAGKTIDQADPEVSEAVDFAHFYAEQAAELDHMDGAVLEPRLLTLVTPPWNFPVAIPAGGVLAALAAGSAAVLKPAPQAERCGAVLADIIGSALDAEGINPSPCRLVQVDETTLGADLVAHDGVDQIILTGAHETAELFASFRPGRRILAETSGKNALVVTPSADFDRAVADVVSSAFGHAGQKCSAASLLVLVGSVASSERFRRQLVDATSSLTVAWPTDAAAQMGPVIAAPSGKLLDGLTRLGSGEHWILQPRPLDDTDRLWSPGIRGGVRPGSAFHRTEYFGPVLGILEAADLDHAIDIVNAVDFGLTSGLHSLDADEIGEWIERVHAGNLYVNRPTTGAIVQRQPFGGWKQSAVGPGAKAGGDDYVLSLAGWRPAHSSHGPSRYEPGVVALLARCRPHLSADELAMLDRAADSDEHHWRTRFAVVRDPAGLPYERNLSRYRPVAGPVFVRLQSGPGVELIRVVAAAVRASVPVAVSIHPEVAGTPLVEALQAADVVVDVEVESGDAFGQRLPSSGRVRLLGADSVPGACVDVAVFTGPATESGRLELRPFLREQSISITAHRFGTPDHLTDAVI